MQQVTPRRSQHIYHYGLRTTCASLIGKEECDTLMRGNFCFNR
ncbi:hypothetical protein l13_17130 [Neisseria weaveri ATCC 51223]|nr:hypothetical protein l13_17130 [Neisseria weaveri ATCC 51223]